MVLNSQVIIMRPLLLINHRRAAGQTRKSNANSTLNENLTRKYNICGKETTYIVFHKVLPCEEKLLREKKMLNHKELRKNEVRLSINRNRTLIFHQINLLDF